MLEETCIIWKCCIKNIHVKRDLNHQLQIAEGTLMTSTFNDPESMINAKTWSKNKVCIAIYPRQSIKYIFTYYLTRRRHQILSGSKVQWVKKILLKFQNFKKRFLEIVQINLIYDMHILPTFHYLHYSTHYIPVILFIYIHFHIHYPTPLIRYSYSKYHTFISYSWYTSY